jgi:NodT family efflux transporter outer membrane factor (OMF) lipoprotein
MNNLMIKKISLLAVSLILTGCASLDFLKLKRTPEAIIKETSIATQWQTPLPHGGSVEKLGEFWQQFNDALLIELIDSAQQVSPTIAAAKTRIAQARSARVSQVANTRPTLDGTFSSSRSVQQPEIDASGGNNSGGAGAGVGGAAGGGFNGGGFGSGATNNTQIGLQTAWELDLFGANKILVESAKKTENAASSNWHEARVAVAAELATSYMNLRFCNAQQLILANDLASRKETARITAIAIKAGFTPSASQYLADASVLDAAQQLNAQQASCDTAIKELVALTAIEEPILRDKLAKQAFNTADISNKYQIDTIPAQVLAQRPDIMTAEAELMAAAAAVQRNQAARLPRVTLNGSIGWMWLSGVGFSGNGEVWSLGPLSITLPIFDSGKRKAEVDSAQASYEESALNYRNKIRVATKEVESALVALHSSAQRNTDLQQALSGYQASFKATEAKVRAGFANLIELEQSRRDALQTETNLINLLQNRSNAWVLLYRAAGGDWQNAQTADSAEFMESSK